MQPNTLTKPVMDVAAPRTPTATMPPRPAVFQPAAVAPAPVPVRPAPFPAAAPAAPTTIPSAPASVTVPNVKKRAVAASATPRKPVALITVTIFVMLVLATLAIAIYVTSNTA
jgi:hypothetical protein